MLKTFLILLSSFTVCIQAFDIFSHFATKTPYHSRPAIHDSHHHPASAPKPEWQCKPVHMFMVTRHGSRFPTKKYMKKFQHLAKVLNHELDTKTGPVWARNWTSPFEFIDDGLLTSSGEAELFDLGRRIRERFPSLYNETYNPYRYNFRATQVPRALQSGTAFANGLFQTDRELRQGWVPLAMHSESKHLDFHLRFHKLCPAYIQKIKKNDEIREQGYIAKAIRQLQEIVATRVQKRLGAQESFSYKETKLLWNACKMEATVFGETNKTCSAFSEEDVLELELADDADDYWFKGHGYRLNHAMSCKLVAAIVESMQEASSPESDFVERAKFWFAHAETVIPLLATLGLYDSGPKWTCDEGLVSLTVDDGAAGGTCSTPIDKTIDRPWRSSAIAPFAANVGFVLYNCDAIPGSSAGFFVQVIHNEQTVVLPNSICNGEWLCPLETFSKGITQAGCEFDELCGVDDNTSGKL